MKSFIHRLQVEAFRFIKVPKNLVFMILGPLAFTLIFGFCYQSDYINDIPLVVFDMDHSSTSRMVVEAFSKNDRYMLIEEVSGQGSFKALIDSQEAHIGLFIPPDFEADLKARRGTNALMVIDESNIAIGNSAMSTGTEILHTLNAGLTMEVLKAKNFNIAKAESRAKLFQIENRNLYDPKLSYKYYMMPGMVIVLVQQLFLSIFVPNLIAHPRNVVEKCIVHVMVGILSASVSLLLLKNIIGLKMTGSILIASLWIGFYLFSLIGIAMVIAFIFNDRRKATQFCMMLSMPTFLLAGYVWPESVWPHALSPVIRLLWPLIHAVSPIRDYMIKGTSPLLFSKDFLILGSYALCWMAVGIFMRKRRLASN